jgi:DNA-directed RNA polymerase subunit E'/Rpb7
MDVFEHVLCKDVIKLEPQFIDKNYKNHVLTKLKKKVEGVCSKHGYIKHDSVQLHKVAPGLVELSTLSGNVTYDVIFYADVCNPLLGTIIKAEVTNSNRFGILAEAGYYVNEKFISILEIVVAKNSVNIQSEIDLEGIKIGDKLNVEIIGKKYELGDKKICAIGRVVKSTKAGKIKNTNNPQEELEEEEENESEAEEDEEEEEEAEAEEEEEADEEEEEPEEEDEEDAEDPEKIGGSDFFSEGEGSLFSEDGEIDDEDDDDKSLNFDDDD